jgi:hypothetical protein
MRYEWGLGVGHTYSWKDPATYRQVPDSGASLSKSGEEPEEPDVDLGCSESEDEAVFCLSDRENEDLGSEESEGDTSEGEASDDE